jgi:hypothetical protein
LSPDAHLKVGFPSAGGAVAARVARSEANRLAVVFAPDLAALTRLDRARDAIGHDRLSISISTAELK